jgi:peptidoglycan-associated lipoprotein
MDEDGLRTKRSVYFDFDSSQIKADYVPGLEAHARYLKDNPKSRVRIEGNADERGPLGYNSALGKKRADNVRQALIGSGAGEKQVVVKSLGEMKPKLTGHDEESWAENRRADIVYEREK